MSGVAKAAASGEDEEGIGFIMHHIKDSHQWHFATIGHTHLTLPLPVIIYEKGIGLREIHLSSRYYDAGHEPVVYKGYRIDENDRLVALDGRRFYDLSITKNVASLFIGVVLLLSVFLTAARHYRDDPLKVPRGMQLFFEPIILFVRDEIARPNIGEKKYERFMPYLLTVFFFIWFNNLMGLLPGAANLTGNISVTLSLAIFTFVITTINGTRDYWKHIFNTPGVPWWLKFPIPIMPVVELIGMFTKPFSLMVRLFANISAGHIIIMSLIALVFIFKSIYIGPVSVLFGLFMIMLELLVAFIQAFVFTLLSAIYFGLASEEHEHEHDEEEHMQIVHEVSS